MADKKIAYVVLLEDRHVDVGIEVFTTKDRAIERAKAITREWGNYWGGSHFAESETEIVYLADPDSSHPLPDDWVYCGDCGEDGAKITVRVVELDPSP